MTIFFEDDVSSLLSVGRGVMESVDRSAENFDLANVPKELYLFDDGGMAEWIADEVLLVLSWLAVKTLIIRVRSQTKVKFCQYHARLH